MKLLAFSLPDASALHKRCWNYFRKQTFCTFSSWRISLKNTKPHSGLWVFSGQTCSWVLIPHTPSMEIQRKTQPPPHATHYSMQLLKRKPRTPWRRLPSPSKTGQHFSDDASEQERTLVPRRAPHQSWHTFSTFIVILIPAWTNLSHIAF